MSDSDNPGNDTTGKSAGNDTARVVPLRRVRKCPICGQPAQHKWRPFCSRRCADIDLHRWLSGQYAIPGEERPTISEDGEPES